MTWTPGKEWATGEVLNVWKLQTFLTDNLRCLRNLNEHACHVSAASSPLFDIPNSGVWTPVPYRVVDWQVGDEIFSTGSPTKFPAPLAGWYELIPVTVWSSASGGSRSQAYRLNGEFPAYDQHSQHTNNNSFQPIQNAIDIVRMTTADYLEVIVKQDSAEDGVAVRTAADNTRCSWRLLGAAS